MNELVGRNDRLPHSLQWCSLIKNPLACWPTVTQASRTSPRLVAFLAALALVAPLLLAVRTAPAEAVSTQRILLVGDSITQQARYQVTWRWRMRQRLLGIDHPHVFVGDRWGTTRTGKGPYRYSCGYHCRHNAISGTGWNYWNHRIKDVVTRLQPTHVMVGLGHNDLNVGATPAQLISRANTFVQRVRARAPEAVIYVAEVKYSDLGTRWNRKARLFNSKLADYVVNQRRGGYRVYMVNLQRPGWDQRTMTFDGVHLNDRGEVHFRQSYAGVLLNTSR